MIFGFVLFCFVFFGFVIFCLTIVIKGVRGEGGGVVFWGIPGSPEGGPGLFLLLQTPHVSRYHELNLSCLEQLVVFGLSILDSNRTNHKLRKKLTNRKRQHVSLRLCGIRTRYCAQIRRRSTQKV